MQRWDWLDTSSIRRDAPRPERVAAVDMDRHTSHRPVFSSAFGGAPTAYHVDARTDRYELGVNIALLGNDALDLGWGHFDSRRARHGSGKYDGNVFRVGYLYRSR